MRPSTRGPLLLVPYSSSVCFIGLLPRLCVCSLPAGAALPSTSLSSGEAKTSSTEVPKPTEVGFFPQLQDHFTFDTDTTFNQRYLVYDGFWALDEGPILFYLGNEGPIDRFYKDTSVLFSSIGPKLKALILFVEHRGYGQSTLDNNSAVFGQGAGDQEEADKKNYLYNYTIDRTKIKTNTNATKLLTIEQALADYARFLVFFQKKRNAVGSPVFVFGGSYGGMLAGWFRVKYPHLTSGAVLSSAPVDFYPGLSGRTTGRGASKALAGGTGSDSLSGTTPRPYAAALSGSSDAGVGTTRVSKTGLVSSKTSRPGEDLVPGEDSYTGAGAVRVVQNKDAKTSLSGVIIPKKTGDGATETDHSEGSEEDAGGRAGEDGAVVDHHSQHESTDVKIISKSLSFWKAVVHTFLLAGGAAYQSALLKSVDVLGKLVVATRKKEQEAIKAKPESYLVFPPEIMLTSGSGARGKTILPPTSEHLSTETLDLAKIFRTCEKSPNTAQLYYYVKGALSTLAMENYPFPFFLTKPLPADPVKVACEALVGGRSFNTSTSSTASGKAKDLDVLPSDQERDPAKKNYTKAAEAETADKETLLSQLAAAVDVYVGTDFCKNTTRELLGRTDFIHDSKLNSASTTSASADIVKDVDKVLEMEPWNVQACSELPMQPLTSDFLGFYPPETFAALEQLKKTCKEVYNVYTRPDFLPVHYGSRDIGRNLPLTKAIIVDGEFDPWRVGSFEFDTAANSDEHSERSASLMRHVYTHKNLRERGDEISSTKNATSNTSTSSSCFYQKNEHNDVVKILPVPGAAHHQDLIQQMPGDSEGLLCARGLILATLERWTRTLKTAKKSGSQEEQAQNVKEFVGQHEDVKNEDDSTFSSIKKEHQVGTSPEVEEQQTSAFLVEEITAFLQHVADSCTRSPACNTTVASMLLRLDGMASNALL
ncbi:unnamed protein product [Amoebophrya sp. A120]|nr:unnamed protein product [Amoebophrya sp. A120]|eukprot:GSA120T00023417001.1